MSGIGSSKWTEGGGRNSVTYEGEETFINATNYFFGKEGAEPIEVSAGVHLYKFSCRIPKNAPGSFEAKYGFIRYKVEVNLDIPYLSDLISEKSFVVVRFEDLNNYPELRMGNEVEEAKTFCCLFCESDPVLVKASTKQSGFVVGDKIPIHVEIYNRSSTSFTKTVISLNRVETYSSNTPFEKTKKHVVPLTAITAQGVEAKKKAIFMESLHIPQNAAVSNDRVSEIVQLAYEVRLSLRPSKKSSSPLEVSIPIYIGTVGFRGASSASNFSVDVTSIVIEGDAPPFCKPVGNVSSRLPPQFEFVM